MLVCDMLQLVVELSLNRYKSKNPTDKLKHVGHLRSQIMKNSSSRQRTPRLNALAAFCVVLLASIATSAQQDPNRQLVQNPTPVAEGSL